MNDGERASRGGDLDSEGLITKHCGHILVEAEHAELWVARNQLCKGLRAGV